MRRIAAIGLLMFTACASESSRPTTPTAPFEEPNLFGSYVLTFTADAAACAAVPAAYRTRVYSTTMPRGPEALLRLSGPEFRGTNAGPTDLMVLSYRDSVATLDFRTPPIIERVTETSFLSVGGVARGAVEGTTSELLASATVIYCPVDDYLGDQCDVPEVRCESTNHTVTLTRVAESSRSAADR